LSKFESRFIFLFLKIVIPLIVIVAISGFALFKKAENEERIFIHEKANILSELITHIYVFDKRYSKEADFDFDNEKATLYQIQEAFKNLVVKDQVIFEYLIGVKKDSYIEFLAYSTKKQPPSIELSDTHLAIPMRKALAGEDGSNVGNDYNEQKVFSAYTPIEGTPWGLVIKQPYENHIAPFKKIALYTFLILFVFLLLMYQILKYYEYKNFLLMQSSEDRFQQLVESTNDWVWEVDIEGRYSYISKQIEQILGYKQSEIVGKTAFELMHEDEANRVSKIFEKLVANREKIVNLENINIHKDGHNVSLLTNGSPFFDIDGTLLGYRGIDKDISDLKAKEAALKHLAYYDSLTGLSNRKTISIRLKEELIYTKRNDMHSALVFMDLDGFKQINDSLGHTYGDKVLKLVAKRLLSVIRDFDVAARVGGDEFILLIRGKNQNCDECQIYLLALVERIIESVNEPMHIENETTTIGISLGIALMPEDADNAAQLIKNADKAMYRAKELGKNQAIFYNSL